MIVFSGFIALPNDAKNKILEVELSVVPSNEDLLFHPHLLHLTKYGKGQKKAFYKTPLTSPSDWRLKFVVEYGSKIYHVPNYGDGSVVDLPDNCLEHHDNEIRLLLGNKKILINIISSLQGAKRSEGCDRITNYDVIERRIEEELHIRDPDTAHNLATMYKSQEFKVELHRARLRARILDKCTGVMAHEAFSNVISNSHSPSVGNLNLHSISDPGGCCTNGKWKFTLISEHKLASDKSSNNNNEDSDRSPPVVPIFVLADKEGNVVEDSFLSLNPIPTDPANLLVHGDAFGITIPAQNPAILEKIRLKGLHCRIRLYRSLDNKYSQNSVKFDYIDHNKFDNCPFCLIKTLSQLTMETVFGNAPDACSGRKRTKRSMSRVQTPDVCTPSKQVFPKFRMAKFSSISWSPSSTSTSPEVMLNNLLSSSPRQNPVSNNHPMIQRQEVRNQYIHQSPQSQDVVNGYGLDFIEFGNDHPDLNPIRDSMCTDSCPKIKTEKDIKVEDNLDDDEKVLNIRANFKKENSRRKKTFEMEALEAEEAMRKLDIGDELNDYNSLFEPENWLDTLAIIFATLLYYTKIKESISI